MKFLFGMKHLQPMKLQHCITLDRLLMPVPTVVIILQVPVWFRITNSIKMPIVNQEAIMDLLQAVQLMLICLFHKKTDGMDIFMTPNLIRLNK